MTTQSFRQRANAAFDGVVMGIGGILLMLLLGAFYLGLLVIFVAAVAWAVQSLF